MQPAPANTVDRFAGGFRLLLALLLLLGVPGIGSSISTRTRVAEEEEQNERDCSETLAWATADGLRLRGRVASPVRSQCAAWLQAASSASAGAIQSVPTTRRLATGGLNGCGAFLRC